MKKHQFFASMLLAMLTAMPATAQEKYFTPSTKEAATPDGEGFIRRWTVLEPISKINRSNTVFIDSYLREVFAKEYFKDQMNIIPKDGQVVKAKSEEQPAPAAPRGGAPGGFGMMPGGGAPGAGFGMPGAGAPGAGQANRPAGAQGAPGQGGNRPAGAQAGAAPGGMPPMGMGFRGMGSTEPPKEVTEKLKWHKLDSKHYNFKLLRFGEHETQRLYGVIYWAVTVINCDEDMENVRLSVGSNSASQWWVNGEDVLLLSSDRRMVADDCMSKRITLKKGENVIRGAIINGPGMSDFCVRICDENGKPITKGYTIK